MRIKFPVNCNSEASRISFAHRADELLRLEHNVMGTKFRDNEITETEWTDYINNNYAIKFKAVHKALSENIALAQQGTFWAVDLSRDIVDGD